MLLMVKLVFFGFSFRRQMLFPLPGLLCFPVIGYLGGGREEKKGEMQGCIHNELYGRGAERVLLSTPVWSTKNCFPSFFYYPPLPSL